jgi:DNA-binding IclR family transcriptional regulator
MYALLQTMSKSGWVQYNDNDQCYSLGVRALEAGSAYTRTLTLPDRARLTMTKLSAELNETVQLSILDGRFNVYIAKVEGRQALRLASEVGRRLPAHATGLGKVLLAQVPLKECRERMDGVGLERFTPNTVTSFEELMDELRLIRQRGYGEDREEYSLGVRCVAVPIFDHTAQAVAAMSVSIPSIRFSRDARQTALRALMKAARELSAALGCARVPV